MKNRILGSKDIIILLISQKKSIFTLKIKIMKITDIMNELPKKVKLNKNFTLEESFDVNTILLIKGVKLDFGGNDNEEKCYKVFVTALAEDMKYNQSIAIADWFDDNYKPTKTYFDVMKKAFDQWGNLNDVIYVMENDDCFDLVNNDSDKIHYAINELNQLNETLKKQNDTLSTMFKSYDEYSMSEKVRIGGKMEGLNMAMEDIRRQIKDLTDKLQ